MNRFCDYYVRVAYGSIIDAINKYNDETFGCAATAYTNWSSFFWGEGAFICKRRAAGLRPLVRFRVLDQV